MRFKWTGNDSEFLTHGKVYEFREHDETKHVFRDDEGLYDHYWDIDRLTEDGWEPVNDSPVREVTVTRREIVEGQYGGIYVAPDGPGQVTLGFDGHYVTFNAEQLAELEHLSAQLREALEDA